MKERKLSDFEPKRSKNNIQIQGEVKIFFDDTAEITPLGCHVLKGVTLRILKPNEVKEFYKDLKRSFILSPHKFDKMVDR